MSARDAMPLTIGFGDEAIAKVKKGESISVPIKLVRRDGGKQPCVLRPRDLPPGVTAAEITIAADADTGQIELKVAADATPTIYSIWLQAETKVKLKQNPESLLRAEQYRAQLAKLLDEPDQASQKDAITAAIKIADQRVEASKPAAQEQEFNIFVASPTVSIEIVNP